MYNRIILNMYCNKCTGYHDPLRANNLSRVRNEDGEAAIIPVNEPIQNNDEANQNPDLLAESNHIQNNTAHGPQQEIDASLDERTPCN